MLHFLVPSPEVKQRNTKEILYTMPQAETRNPGSTGNYHLSKHGDGYHVWCGEVHGGKASFSEILLWELLQQARSLVKDLYENAKLPENSELAVETKRCLEEWGSVGG